MKLKSGLFKLFTFYTFCCLASTGFTQELSLEERTKSSLTEINDYTVLIEQINLEKENKIGYESRALNKHLAVTAEAYRNLIWQFADELSNSENNDALVQHKPAALSYLTKESDVLRKEIEQNDQTVIKLEKQIIDAKKRIFTVNQAITKDRMADIQWKLHLQRIHQEKLYSALVKNALKINALEGDADQDISLANDLVRKQADMLSGLIGITKDKLIKLDKKISVIRNDSETGKKLIADIAIKNLEIQDYASRLQKMVSLLTDMKVDSSLYKKTVIQSQNTLNSDIFDKNVASHLFTEWWLKTKQWLIERAPNIIGKTLTFISILFLAALFAALIKKMLRGLFQRTKPNMSQLAKNFLVSVSSKIVMMTGFLIALSNLGIQIAPILAGLGIMGFIIGFAFQETLSNFASGLMILVYRPFDVGDKIRISGREGKVNKMNLVSTTIFTSSNHHLTIPNNKIWNDIIHNITSQPEVRMDLFFSAPFNAASETVLTAIKNEVESNPIVIKEKAKNVRIQELGDSEVKYIARFWISSDDIDETKWVISEGVKKRFDQMGISQEITESLQVRIFREGG